MSKELIPFGKLKGRPLEELARHKEYAKWLTEQPDIRKKYPDICLYVINHFRIPDDSPEHNKLQIKFSNSKRDYALKLAYFLVPDLFIWDSEKINNELKKRLGKPGKHRDAIKSKLEEQKENGLLYISPIKKEEGYDVEYAVRYGQVFRFEYEIPDRDDTFHFQLNCSKFLNIFIEIKPHIGEDFPSALRQIKASMPIRHNDEENKFIKCLLVGSYSGQTASRDEFIEYFQDEGYRVVFSSDLEELSLPQFEVDFKLNFM